MFFFCIKDELPNECFKLQVSQRISIVIVPNFFFRVRYVSLSLSFSLSVAFCGILLKKSLISFWEYQTVTLNV
jgi:hypothetical protein